MRERMTWYVFVMHNAPSFDAPDMTVYALDYQSYIFQAGEKGMQTHQLLVVSHPCTSELCDAPPLTLGFPAFHLLVSHEL
jgi:hypothetical protein